MDKELIWTWEWVGGGYNSCLAATREVALVEAFRIGTPGPAGGMKHRLIPDLLTLRSVSEKEMWAIDRSWAASFD